MEPQRWIVKGMWCLPTIVFMALIAGFPWQTQAQTPCPRASQCVPDGVLTVTFSVSGDISGCVFNATVNWGDGVINHVSNIVDGQTITHTYDAPGTYTVHIGLNIAKLSYAATCRVPAGVCCDRVVDGAASPGASVSAAPVSMSLCRPKREGHV